jgi:lycopene cyclase domain-containing protein
MKAYTIFNFVLSLIILPLGYWLAGKQSRRHILAVASRISLKMTLIAYPWDFFAIRYRIWRYPVDPGLQLYEVPLNDLLFIWICTYLACTLLSATARWESARQRHSEGEGTCE